MIAESTIKVTIENPPLEAGPFVILPTVDWYLNHVQTDNTDTHTYYLYPETIVWTKDTFLEIMKGCLPNNILESIYYSLQYIYNLSETMIDELSVVVNKIAEICQKGVAGSPQCSVVFNTLLLQYIFDKNNSELFTKSVVYDVPGYIFKSMMWVIEFNHKPSKEEIIQSFNDFFIEKRLTTISLQD